MAGAKKERAPLRCPYWGQPGSVAVPPLERLRVSARERTIDMKDSRTDSEALDHNYTEGTAHKKQEQAQQFKIRLSTGTYRSADAGQLCAEMLFDREKYRL